MLEGLVSGLLVAAILSCFGIDQMFVEVIQPLIAEMEITASHFYAFIALIGMVGGIFSG